MTEKTDIRSIEDIKVLVNMFYERARASELLSEIFNRVIGDRWPAHLEKMYRFWQTVLLGEHTYNGSPFPPHAQLPINDAHFEAWLQLWQDTVDMLYTGNKAEEAKWRGSKMAELFAAKIMYYKSHTATPLI